MCQIFEPKQSIYFCYSLIPLEKDTYCNYLKKIIVKIKSRGGVDGSLRFSCAGVRSRLSLFWRYSSVRYLSPISLLKISSRLVFTAWIRVLLLRRVEVLTRMINSFIRVIIVVFIIFLRSSSIDTYSKE